jgi:hypothetical protein
VNAFWTYFWPLFAIGVVFGGLSGAFAIRRRRRFLFAIGAVLVLAGAYVWHAPLGAADRLTSAIETEAATGLRNYEMTAIQAKLHRGPLTRRLILSGPADDFQRSELVRIMETIPGVSTASWSGDSGGRPLLLEGMAVAVLGFLAGLLLAYVVELRRRYNAQWKW